MRTGVDTLKKVGSVAVGIRGDPRAWSPVKVETLTIETRYDKDRRDVWVVARPEMCVGGIGSDYLDRHPNEAYHVTSAPEGIDLKRAREIAREVKCEVTERLPDFGWWRFVLDVCRKRGYLIADEPDPIEVTDEEWALLDTLLLDTLAWED